MGTMRDKESGARADPSTHFFFDRLAEYREIVLTRMTELVPSRGRYRQSLYEPMLDYPLREGKGFRPALLLSMCQACGGSLVDALDTAVALEMFHNAFLVHATARTIYTRAARRPFTPHGLAIATNVGDALNMLALNTLLGNTGLIGLERSLTVIEDVGGWPGNDGGQSIELDWCPGRRVPAALGRLRDLQEDHLVYLHRPIASACSSRRTAERLSGLVALGFGSAPPSRSRTTSSNYRESPLRQGAQRRRCRG